MKDQAFDHIKTKRLKRLLRLPQYHVIGVLESIWQLAAKCADDGAIGRYSNEEIADYIEWDGEADDLAKALVEAGWLDSVEDSRRLVVHDWDEHAPEYIKERNRKRHARDVRKPSGHDRDTTGTVPPLSGNVPPLSGESPDKRRNVPSIPSPTKPNQAQPNQASLVQEGLDLVKTEDVQDLAGAYFAGIGYDGNSGGNLWGIAALAVRGKIPEHWTADAIAGTNSKSPRPSNPPAYFYRIVAEHASKAGKDLKQMLRAVKFTPRWPTGPPDIRRSNSRKNQFTPTIKGPNDDA